MKSYFLLFCCLLSFNTFAKNIVKVGIYEFPPYVFADNKLDGITLKVIAAMNDFQDQYKFVAVPTTAKRRYSDFEKNKFDLIIFENKNWGWQSFPIEASEVFVSGSEVYVTQAETGKGQNYFSDFKNKAMIGVLGYHYKFADYQTEQEIQKKHFNIFLTNSQQKSLELILKSRGDIAVLSKEYLHHHFSHSPADKNKLLISDKVDQIYQHTILVRKNKPLTVQYINTLLDRMKKQSILTSIWKQYGLEETN